MFSKLVQAVSKGRGRAGGNAPEASGREGGADAAAELVRGDVVVVAEGQPIPCDGRVLEGMALVDESAITGESAPVTREAGSDRGDVIAGTTVVSGRIVVEVRGAR